MRLLTVLVSSEAKILKVAGYSQNRSKITLLKGSVDGFSYFSLIFIYFIFLLESSPSHKQTRFFLHQYLVLNQFDLDEDKFFRNKFEGFTVYEIYVRSCITG